MGWLELLGLLGLVGVAWFAWVGLGWFGWVELFGLLDMAGLFVDDSSHVFSSTIQYCKGTSKKKKRSTSDRSKGSQFSKKCFSGV